MGVLLKSVLASNAVSCGVQITFPKNKNALQVILRCRLSPILKKRCLGNTP